MCVFEFFDLAELMIFCINFGCRYIEAMWMIHGILTTRGWKRLRITFMTRKEVQQDSSSCMLVYDNHYYTYVQQ